MAKVYLDPGHGFTFQYGEIKSGKTVTFANIPREFTFQYGEIKSLCQVPAATLR